jgi:hypothetical protein
MSPATPMPLCLRAPFSSAKGSPKILTWVAEVAAFWLVSGASAREKLTVHSLRRFMAERKWSMLALTVSSMSPARAKRNCRSALS